MFDESTMTSSAADFTELKREAYEISLVISIPRDKYSNLAILADEYKEELQKKPLEEVARSYYNSSLKICFIKYLRTRFEKLDLISAKMMADGFWIRFGAEQERNNYRSY